MNRLGVLGLLILMLAGCATSTFEYGADFSDNDVASIEQGVTTMQDVRDMFGEPSSVSSNSSNEVSWSYHYVSSTAHAQSKIFSMDVKSDTFSKSLIIVFDDNVVLSYEHSTGGERLGQRL